MVAKPLPPTEDIRGSKTVSATAAATAASKALPPCCSTRIPAIEASGSSEVTIACRPVINGLSTIRGWCFRSSASPGGSPGSDKACVSGMAGSAVGFWQIAQLNATSTSKAEHRTRRNINDLLQKRFVHFEHVVVNYFDSLSRLSGDASPLCCQISLAKRR